MEVLRRSDPFFLTPVVKDVTIKKEFVKINANKINVMIKEIKIKISNFPIFTSK